MKCLSFLWLLLLAAITSAVAQVPKPPAPRPTLEQALKSLPPDALPSDGPLMVVGAEAIFPKRTTAVPADAPLPDEHTPGGILAAYDLTTQTFGHLTALAPAQMTVLNANPDPLTLSAKTTDLPTALQILVGNLSADQLRQLGSDGLTLADLTDEQRAFYQSAVPHPLQIIAARLRDSPDYQTFPNDHAGRIAAWEAYKAMTQALSADVFLGNVRLRACLAAEFKFVTPPGEPDIDVASPPDLQADPKQYLLALNNVSGVGRQQEKNLVGQVPNVLKDGDLSWDSRALEATVPTTGLKIVGDLVKQAATRTGLELHCDPRYAARSVAFFGPVPTAVPAADLLRALDLCLAATWRKVGPAYVLTDDVQGLAQRRHHIREVIGEWSGTLARMTRDAGRNFTAQDGAGLLPFAAGDSAALPADLVQKIVGAGDPDRPNESDMPFGRLPSSVQAYLRTQLQHDAAQATDEPIAFDDDHPDLKMSWKERYRQLMAALPTRTVAVTLKMRCFLEVPQMGTITLDNGLEYLDLPFAARPETPDTSGKPIALTEKVRGLLYAPQRPKEAAEVVDRMAALGLNTFYCDVFSDGKTAFPNTDLPPPVEASGVLAAAIAAGQRRHIAVYAVQDTLRWRSGAVPHAEMPLDMAEDVTVTGEGAHQALDLGLIALEPNEDFTRMARLLDDGGWVPGDDAAVGKVLTGLTAAGAATPGLAGLVFQDTRAPGYNTDTAVGDGGVVELGYTPAMRLAFLRAHDADPADIPTGVDSGITVYSGNEVNSMVLSLPNFPDDSDGTLESAWRAFRTARNQELMNRLFAAARSAAPTLPLLMRDPDSGMFLAPWTDPGKPPLSAGANLGGSPSIPPGIVFILPMTMLSPDLSDLKPSLADLQKGFPDDGGHGPEGLVFDLESGLSPEDARHDLETLSGILGNPHGP